MKKFNFIFSIFLIVGLILLIIGSIICFRAFDYSNTAETKATITEFESYRERRNGKWRTFYKTYITYEVNGESYNGVADMYSSSWEIGEEIEIYYDLDNPSKFGSKKTDLALIVVPCLGLLFSSLGTVLLVISHKRAKNN